MAKQKEIEDEERKKYFKRAAKKEKPKTTDGEKMLDKFIQQHAKDAGEEYFKNVLASLFNKIEDVRRNQQSWRIAYKGGSHPNGHKPGKEQIVQQIEWTMDALSQTDFHYAKGANAIALLTDAKKIQLF